VIINAANPGAISLMTRVFGRGTDFSCMKRAKEAGGVHVIQTFLSEDVAEEVQIRGRTARESSKGSFVKILEMSSLERFGLDDDAVENLRRSTSAVEIDREINDKRLAFFDMNCLKHLANITKISDMHRQTQTFLEDLLNKRIERVKAFLMKEEENMAPPIDEGKLTSRTLILMDATGSMGHCIEAAKSTVDIMFKRLRQVLEVKAPDKQVWVQFAAYRNYSNTADTVLVHSAWVSAASQLKPFLDTIRPDGGQGNEAVELGLAHAVLLHDSCEEGDQVSQIALIGDMPPNTVQEVTDKRASRGESYWSQTKFAKPTSYEVELAKIIQRKIPIHCFCIGSSPRPIFSKIAQQSVDEDGEHGTCQDLDLKNADMAAENLLDTLSKTICQDAGGADAVTYYMELKRKGAFVA
jgi:hypothetical protein